MTTIIDFRSAEFESLIDKCIQNERNAWNRFFTIFTPHIKRYIVKALLGSSQSRLANDEDVIEEIFVQVVEIIYRPKQLAGLESKAAIGKWLKIITANKVKDFIRAGRVQKNAIRRIAESRTLSLDHKLSEDQDTDSHEILVAPESENERAFDEAWSTLKNEIQKLDDRSRWILRLKTLFHQPMDDDEIRELAQILNVPESMLEKKLSLLMDSLCNQNVQREGELSAARRLEGVITELEKRLGESEGQELLSDNERDQLRDRIQRKAQKMRETACKGMLDVMPSNDQVAEILNIPSDKVGSISTLLFRARKKLKKGLAYQQYQSILAENN